MGLYDGDNNRLGTIVTHYQDYIVYWTGTEFRGIVPETGLPPTWTGSFAIGFSGPDCTGDVYYTDYNTLTVVQPATPWRMPFYEVEPATGSLRQISLGTPIATPMISFSRGGCLGNGYSSTVVGVPVRFLGDPWVPPVLPLHAVAEPQL